MFEQVKKRLDFSKRTVSVPEHKLPELTAKLTQMNVPHEVTEEGLVVDYTRLPQVKQAIESLIVPNLLPVQFYWLLAISGLEPVIGALLEILKDADVQKYAIYQAFLKGARFYEFDKALAMLQQAQPVIAQAYPDLDLSVETLKTIWMQATQV